MERKQCKWKQYKQSRKRCNNSDFSIYIPFSFKTGYEQNMFPFLQKNDFRPFRLDHLENENTYYGKFQVSHQNMEAYYLSFTNKILFPHSENQKGLQRYSKTLI